MATVVIATSTHKYNIRILTPVLTKIDVGATPVRTKKGITFRCIPRKTTAREQDHGGFINKFDEIVILEVAVRDAKAEGQRLGREPGVLVTIEKWLVDLIKTNRDALHDDGIQYIDVVSAETFPTIEGSEERQQVWYHLNLTIKLHYWMRITEPQ